MPTWLIAVLPVISALLGVLAGNWGAARRETISRLWEQRAETYRDIIRWTLSVDSTITKGSGEPYDLPADDFRNLQLPDELLAQTWAFASQQVLYAQGPCRNYLFLLSEGTDKTPGEDGISEYFETLVELTSSLIELRKIIRQELSGGKLRVPLAFRLSERTFPARRRVRMYLRQWKTRRSLPRGDASSGSVAEQ